MDLTTLLLTGAVAGVMAGLLGIGGGVVIVPVVALMLESEGVAPDVLIKVAVGTSLATIMVTAVSSVLAHHRRGAVDWPVFRRMVGWIVFGTVIGTLIADVMSGRLLYLAFILFLYAAAVRMAIGRVSGHRPLPGTPGMALIGTANGAISAMMGIGGGVMNVPFLSYCSVPVKRAVATAAALGLPLATASAIGYALTGLNEQGIPEHSIGYINLPVFAGVVSASMLFAPLGARLAHALPDRAVSLFFALFLFVMATRMAWPLLAG